MVDSLNRFKSVHFGNENILCLIGHDIRLRIKMDRAKGHGPMDEAGGFGTISQSAFDLKKKVPGRGGRGLLTPMA